MYEAAFADAAEEAGVSDRERALLNHLKHTLGLSQDDVNGIELKFQSRVQ